MNVTRLLYRNHSSSCDLIIHYSKSRMKNFLEPLPNQQQTIKDEEESQDVESLDPAMIDMMHTMMKTTPGVNHREFCYAETHQLNSQCRIFCGRPPPACRHQIAERQGPKPRHQIHEGMQHYQQGNARQQW